MNQSLTASLKDPLVKSVVQTAFPNYRGRKIRIRYQVKSISLRSYWDGGSKDTFVVMRLVDKKAVKAPTSHPVFDHWDGVDNFEIPEGFIVVEHSIFCGRDAGITIHTPGAPGLLGAGDNTAQELSRVQTMVLGWLVGLTSAGRKDALIRYRFPQYMYDRICQELAEMGLAKIAKNGAVRVTLDGQNYPIDRNTSDHLRWYDCFDYDSGSWGGWAAEAIQKYHQYKS